MSTGPRLRGDPDQYIRRVRNGKYQARPYCAIDQERYDLGLFDSAGEARTAVVKFWRGKLKPLPRFTRAYHTAQGERYMYVVPSPAPTGKRVVTVPGFETRDAAHDAALKFIRENFPADRVETILRRSRPSPKGGIDVEGLLTILKNAGFLPEPAITVDGQRRWKRAEVLDKLRPRQKEEEGESVPEQPAADNPDSLLMTIKQVAHMLGRTLNATYCDDYAGNLPAPVYIGRETKRWRRAEVIAWISAGCPLRDAWSAIWAAQQPGAVQPQGNAQLAVSA